MNDMHTPNTVLHARTDTHTHTSTHTHSHARIGQYMQLCTSTHTGVHMHTGGLTYALPPHATLSPRLCLYVVLYCHVYLFCPALLCPPPLCLSQPSCCLLSLDISLPLPDCFTLSNSLSLSALQLHCICQCPLRFLLLYPCSIHFPTPVHIFCAHPPCSMHNP